MHVALVLAGLVFYPFATAQTGNDCCAMLRGTVTTGYPSHRPVSNVRVVAISDGDVRETRTDSHGKYLFLTLLPGVYRVSTYPENVDPTRPHLEMLVLSARAGAVVPRPGMPVYVGTRGESIRQCAEEAQAPVELSAGLEYVANIELVTHCP
jgi:Carboxypeptidase regulatory-like domain